MSPSRILALAALSAAALGVAPAAASQGAIEDDWPRALAAAKERSVPILVDAWAPW